MPFQRAALNRSQFEVTTLFDCSPDIEEESRRQILVECVFRRTGFWPPAVPLAPPPRPAALAEQLHDIPDTPVEQLLSAPRIFSARLFPRSGIRSGMRWRIYEIVLYVDVELSYFPGFSHGVEFLEIRCPARGCGFESHALRFAQRIAPPRVAGLF